MIIRPLILLCLVAPSIAWAQNTLTDQINAVDAAQRRQQAAEIARQAAQQAAQRADERRVAEDRRAAAALQKQREDAAAAVQKQHEETAAATQQRREQAAAVAQQKREEMALTEQKKKEEEIIADKRRQQEYEDKLRDLEIQQRTVAVQADKAKLARVNEYIDQDLKAKAAITDVVQSDADATRNISAGTKTLLEKTGEAEVKSQSGLFK